MLRATTIATVIVDVLDVVFQYDFSNPKTDMDVKIGMIGDPRELFGVLLRQTIPDIQVFLTFTIKKRCEYLNY